LACSEKGDLLAAELLVVDSSSPKEKGSGLSALLLLSPDAVKALSSTFLNVAVLCEMVLVANGDCMKGFLGLGLPCARRRSTPVGDIMQPVVVVSEVHAAPSDEAVVVDGVLAVAAVVNNGDCQGQVVRGGGGGGEEASSTDGIKSDVGCWLVVRRIIEGGDCEISRGCCSIDTDDDIVEDKIGDVVEVEDGHEV
jgi:hypothetical protein